MRMRWQTFSGGFGGAVAAVLLAVPFGAHAQESYRVPGADVALYNLAGHVELVRGSGADVVVRVTRGGADSERLSVEVGEIGGRQTLRVIYPGDRVIYPTRGRGSQTTVRVRPDGTFGDGGDRVSIRGSGSGLEAWADLRVEVPAGLEMEVRLAVGELESTGLSGDLSLDTGSGSITVRGHAGRLNADTGSGSIDVRDVEGETSVDTGSGGVEISNVRGPRVRVDTGSGGVSGGRISAESLMVDTGSGGIRLSEVASPDVSLDTGSGSVDVDLTMDIERLEVDTGSGSVTIRVPTDLGAELDVETGSGGIDVDFPVELQVMRRNELRARVGDGRGRIVIETGSGRVRLVR